MSKRYFLRLLEISLIIVIFSRILAGEPAPITLNNDNKQPKSLGQEYWERKDTIIQAEKEQNTFNAEARLELALWALQANKDWLTPLAMQDLKEIIKHEPDQLTARQLLGFFKYQEHWVTTDEFIKIKEDETDKLLCLLKATKSCGDKNESKDKREETIKSIKEIEVTYKIRPLIKALQDSSEDLEVFAIGELQDSKEKAVIPYLVRTSLTAEKDSVRNKAISAVKTFDVKESIPWYWHYLNASRKSFDGIIRERTIQSFGELGSEATYSLICEMYNVLLDIKFQSVLPTGTFPGLRNERIQFTNPAAGGQNPPVSLMGSVNYELPDVRFVGIQTTIKAPAGGTISLDNPLIITLPGFNQQKNTAKNGSPVPDRNGSGLEYQLYLCGNALEKVTCQTFGTDYEKWLVWYKENNKAKK